MAIKITEQGVLNLSTPIGEPNLYDWKNFEASLRQISSQNKAEINEIRIVRPEERVEKDALINLAKSVLPGVRIIVQSEL